MNYAVMGIALLGSFKADASSQYWTIFYWLLLRV